MATIAAQADAPLSDSAAGGGDTASPNAARIEGLDFIRGIALCGILLMNITAFGLPSAYTNPMNAGGATGANLWTWIITQVGFEGTQRAIFSMLFGASTILLVTRLEQSGRADAADIYYRRNLWLIAFGMVNAFVFLWYGDILYGYGLTALFIYPFRKLAPKWLLAVGAFGILVSSAWYGVDTYRLLQKHEAWEQATAAQAAHQVLSTEQVAAIAAWESARGDYEARPEEIALSIRNHTSGYLTMFVYVAPINADIQSWLSYRYFFDIFAMMIIGMALFRMGVLTGERSVGFDWAMLLGGYGIGLAVRIVSTWWVIDQGFSALSFAQTNIGYDLGRLTMAMGHLGAMLLFVRSGALARVRRAFAAVGQMAVTNYLVQSVICEFIFVGLGWFDRLERHQLYYIVAAIWVAQLVFCSLWLRHFRFGPVEWLWRSLTYVKWQPLRRLAAGAGSD